MLRGALAEAQVAQVPAGRMADYTQAQMDLGATVCSRARPACVICPMQEDCVARREGRTAELPTPKPGKTLPEREAVALLLRDPQQRVLLQKRPDTGIWAQLWTLPQAEAGSDLQDWFDAHVDGSLEEADELPVLQHTFSHYRLHLQVLSRQVRGLRVEVPALRWVAADELPALGLPAPIPTLLDRTPMKPPHRRTTKPRNHQSVPCPASTASSPHYQMTKAWLSRPTPPPPASPRSPHPACMLGRPCCVTTLCLSPN